MAEVAAEADAAMEMGEAAEAAGELVDAAMHYLTASDLAPDAPEPRQALGSVRQQLAASTGDSSWLGQAVEAVEEAVVLAPNDPDVWHDYGCALYLDGRFAEASVAHDREVQLHLSGSDVNAAADAVVLVAQSRRLAEPSDVAGRAAAIAEYDRALALQPGHPIATAERAVLTATSFWEGVRANCGGKRRKKAERTTSSAASTETSVDLKKIRSQSQAACPLVPYRTISLPDSVPTPLHSIYCLHWLSAQKCFELIDAIEKHGEWGSNRHPDFATVDIELSTAPLLRDWIVPSLQNLLLPTMALLFDVPAPRLVPREVFAVKYTPSGQPNLPLHRDGYTLSFSVLLSDPTSFEGGGTRFESLQQSVLPSRAGDVVMHSGQMLHGASAVTRGVRYIVVGFVEISEPSVRGQIDAEDCALALQNEGGLNDLDEGLAKDQAVLHRYWRLIQNSAAGNRDYNQKKVKKEK